MSLALADCNLEAALSHVVPGIGIVYHIGVDVGTPLCVRCLTVDPRYGRCVCAVRSVLFCGSISVLA